MSTQTTAGAREHARSQAGTITDSMPVLPATRWPNPPEDVAPERLTWLRPCRVGGTRPRFSHVNPIATSRHRWQRLRKHLALSRRRPLGASQRRRYRQGAMAGLSRRRAPVALRSGASTCDRGRRHVGSPHAFCGTTSRATNEAKYGQGSLHSAHPPGVNCSPSLPRKTGSGRRTSRLRCPSSMVSASRRTALSPVRVPPRRRDGRSSDPPARHRDDRQHRAPTRSGAAVSHHVPRSARVEGRRRTRQP